MRIYVETNFILELVLLQSESSVCEQLLEMTKGGKAELVVPAFCIVEPHWKVFSNKSKRNLFRGELQRDRKQLSRTTGYQSEITQIEEIEAILSRVTDEEQKRYSEVRKRILSSAVLIPLDKSILDRCAEFEPYFKQFTDLVVCSSILSHQENSENKEACLLTKDKEDFLDPIVEQLFNDRNCRIFSGFGSGIGLVRKDVK